MNQDFVKEMHFHGCWMQKMKNNKILLNCFGCGGIISFGCLILPKIFTKVLKLAFQY